MHVHLPAEILPRRKVHESENENEKENKTKTRDGKMGNCTVAVAFHPLIAFHLLIALQVSHRWDCDHKASRIADRLRKRRGSILRRVLADQAVFRSDPAQVHWGKHEQVRQMLFNTVLGWLSENVLLLYDDHEPDSKRRFDLT